MVGARLGRLGVRFVIVELEAQRVGLVGVQAFSRLPIGLVGDPRRPETLRDAGIAKPECRAVIALTNDDESNQTIAIGARALDPLTRVIARVSTPGIQDSLAEFGGVQIIDPVARFGQLLQADMTAPGAVRIEQWLTAAPGTPRVLPPELPRGHWVLAGENRFIQPALHAILSTGQTARALSGETVEDDLKQSRIASATGHAAGDATDPGDPTTSRLVRGGNT